MFRKKPHDKVLRTTDKGQYVLTDPSTRRHPRSTLVKASIQFKPFPRPANAGHIKPPPPAKICTCKKKRHHD